MTTQPLAAQDLDLSQFEGATPGPWTIHKNTDTAVVGRTGFIVAACGGYSNNTREPDSLHAELSANAKLVAAAPQLLAEVIRLRAEVRRCADDARRLDALDQWREPMTGHTVIGGECEEVLLGYWFGVRGRCETVREAIDAALAAPHPSTAASEAAGAGE